MTNFESVNLASSMLTPNYKTTTTTKHQPHTNTTQLITQKLTTNSPLSNYMYRITVFAPRFFMMIIVS